MRNASFELIEITMENDALKEAIARKVAEFLQYRKLKQRMSSGLSYQNHATGNGN